MELLEERVVPDGTSPYLLAAPTISPAHFGSSPFAPPAKTDQVFVVDQGPYLDTGCSFRSQGPLVIDLPIDRFFGDNTPDLIQKGRLPATVTLEMPAYDVDVKGVPGDPSIPPERDLVTFIGKDGVEHQLGYLDGDNNIWQLNTFQLDTNWLNLPTDPGPGGTLAPNGFSALDD